MIGCMRQRRSGLVRESSKLVSRSVTMTTQFIELLRKHSTRTDRNIPLIVLGLVVVTTVLLLQCCYCYCSLYLYCYCCCYWCRCCCCCIFGIGARLVRCYYAPPRFDLTSPIGRTSPGFCDAPLGTVYNPSKAYPEMKIKLRPDERFQ